MREASDATGTESFEASSVVLDLTGLKCPLPALRTRKALRGLAPGTLLVVTATDPLAGLDIPNVAREEGDRIEARTRGNAFGETQSWRFAIRRMGADAD